MRLSNSGGQVLRRSAKALRQVRKPRSVSTPSTRELILAAASDSFAKQGSDRASMRAIAKLSGVTAGAIYSHFEDKAQLLMEVVKRTLDSLPLSANRITGEEEPGILAENAATHTDPASKMLRRLSLEVHTAAARDEKLKAQLLDYDEMIIGKLKQIVERAQQNGRIDNKREPEFTARALIVFLMGLNHLDTLYPQLLGDPSWRRFVVATANELLGTKTLA